MFVPLKLSLVSIILNLKHSAKFQLCLICFWCKFMCGSIKRNSSSTFLTIFYHPFWFRFYGCEFLGKLNVYEIQTHSFIIISGFKWKGRPFSTVLSNDKFINSIIIWLWINEFWIGISGILVILVISFRCQQKLFFSKRAQKVSKMSRT